MIGEIVYEREGIEERLSVMHDRILSKALTRKMKPVTLNPLFESIRTHINEYGQEFWYAPVNYSLF